MEVISAKGSGGTGSVGGQGETQLELERRSLNDREAKIRAELESIKSAVSKRPKDVSMRSYPTIAIVGYTNAGKTALMNYFTGANLISKDLLFQTLNTTSRQLILPSGQFGLLQDTVGFITDLPHDLVESFKATLEGILTADIILHIRDIAHPMTEVQRHTVLSVLQEIGLPEAIWMPRYIEVWNKIDLLSTPLPDIPSSSYPVISISALHGTNCPQLLSALDSLSMKVMKKKRITILFPMEETQIRLQWLRTNLNMDLQHVRPYEKGGESLMAADVVMDEIALKRYLAHFQEEVANN